MAFSFNGGKDCTILLPFYATALIHHRHYGFPLSSFLFLFPFSSLLFFSLILLKMHNFPLFFIFLVLMHDCLTSIRMKLSLKIDSVSTIKTSTGKIKSMSFRSTHIKTLIGFLMTVAKIHGQDSFNSLFSTKLSIKFHLCSVLLFLFCRTKGKVYLWWRSTNDFSSPSSRLVKFMLTSTLLFSSLSISFLSCNSRWSSVFPYWKSFNFGIKSKKEKKKKRKKKKEKKEIGKDKV